MSIIKNRYTFLRNIKSYCGYSTIPASLNDRKNKSLSTKQIDEIIKLAPELEKFNEDLLHKTYNSFIAQGFSSSNFTNIISKQPNLLKYDTNKLLNSIECWRGTQFGQKQVFELLEQYPELLTYNNEASIRTKLGFLLPYALTRKNIWRMFMNAPNLITDQEHTIQSKINYLQNVMKAEMTDVVKSTVLSHTLQEIINRHIFLDRLGLYKPRSPKADPLEPNKNAKMHQIYDSTDKVFATKVAGVTLEEYECFQELHKKELDKTDVLDDFEFN